MAQVPFRANLQTQAFPLLSELSGRTVIVPQQDQTFVPGVSIPLDGQVPIDRGVPQIYYAHNVMPSTYGYQSVGYDLEYTGIDWGGVTPSPVTFKTVYFIQGASIVSGKPASTGFKTYITMPKAGPNSVFVLDPLNKRWRMVAGAPTVTASTVITVATVNGVTYIYFSKIGCYIYNNNTNALVKRTLAGLAESTIIGLVAANGYLFAYSTLAVAWSSTVNVEDFTPSDVSGAGGGNVQEAKGNIVTAAVTSLGLILFTEGNAVSVIYSGNADFPWNFKAIPSSGGIATASQVSLDPVNGFQQAYTTNGLQQIGHTGAKTIYPQITDFLSGQIFENYDSATSTLTQVEIDWIMNKGLAVVADRYIVLSYGLYPTAQMTYAIVLDITQSRQGKLKIPHFFCFELRSLLSGVVETPRGALAFLNQNGDIHTVNFNLTAPALDSVMLLGKYQYIRQRMLEIFTIELENVKTGADFSITALPSLDGKTLAPEVPATQLVESNNYREFAFQDLVGTNISFLFKGRFNIVSFIMWFAPHGRR